MPPFALLLGARSPAPDWYPEDPETCLALANAIVVVHVLVVGFVLVGEGLILLGWWRRWSWVGNRWFRIAHLATIAFIAVQALLDRICPLTTWEFDLRLRAGKPIEDAGFIARWLHELLYVDVEQSTLNVCYVAFAAVVLASIRLVPVRWRRSRGH